MQVSLQHYEWGNVLYRYKRSSRFKLVDLLIIQMNVNPYKSLCITDFYGINADF